MNDTYAILDRYYLCMSYSKEMCNNGVPWYGDTILTEIVYIVYREYCPRNQ